MHILSSTFIQDDALWLCLAVSLSIECVRVSAARSYAIRTYVHGPAKHLRFNLRAVKKYVRVYVLCACIMIYDMKYSRRTKRQRTDDGINID